MKAKALKIEKAMSAALFVLLLVVVGTKNALAQTQGALNGVFSVSENTQVYFSQGNLQYRASANTWRFASNQWDYIGSGNTYISSSYSGWIDLFGWGTSGYNHGATCYQPWSTSNLGSNYYAYANPQFNLYDQTGKADWGYNKISNGGNQENSGWRTLTSNEWNYVFFTRSTTSGIRYAKAQVNGVKGIILLPNNWSESIYPLNSVNTSNASYTSNTINTTGWQLYFETNGAVFLPAASQRYWSSLNGAQVGNTDGGFYWASMAGNYSGNSAFAKIMSFDTYGVYNANSSISRANGCSVRLVCNVETTTYTIGVSANPVEGGTVSGGGTYEEGASCTITATANSGYQFYNWTVDGEEVSTNASYQFTVTAAANYVANFKRVHTQILNKGWNWYSTYIEQEGIDGLGQLENSIGVPKAIIQSQYDGYVKSILRNGNVLWGGALSSINNEEMYKIGTKYIRTATMEGQVTDPANHPITIYKGWNWIGFPCSQSVSINVALSGFSPKNGDVIKGISSNATYSNGSWSGTLNTLEPGQGYMYGSNDRRPKTLVFQSGRGEANIANITPANNFYQPVDDYADNMTVIAVVELDGEELRSEGYELDAFAGDECRGSVKLMYVAPIDRYVAFLTVFGDKEEDLHFRLTDGIATSLSTDRLTYATDGILGSLDNPAVLHFGPMDVEENALADVKVYPNPSEGIFNIEGQNIKKVEVFNALGQPVYAKDMENGLMMIDLTNRASGIYLVRVVTDNGIWSHQVMKK